MESLRLILTLITDLHSWKSKKVNPIPMDSKYFCQFSPRIILMIGLLPVFSYNHAFWQFQDHGEQFENTKNELRLSDSFEMFRVSTLE